MIGGSNDNEGRVEVCVLGQWGTVCDDGWSQQNAKVACNQLGIDGGKTFKINLCLPLVKCIVTLFITK